MSRQQPPWTRPCAVHRQGTDQSPGILQRLLAPLPPRWQKLGTILRQPLLTYHRFISFCLYCGGIVGFVVSLVKKHYLQQFTLFGWTHMALLVLVTSSHFMIRNVFNGLLLALFHDHLQRHHGLHVRLLLRQDAPHQAVGRRRPGKASSVAACPPYCLGVLLSHFLIQFDFFVCPLESGDAVSMNCVRHWDLPRRSTFHIPVVGKLLFLSSIPWYPFYWHSIIMAHLRLFCRPRLAASLRPDSSAPSKSRTFGDLIPGHGGMTDRFDCQIIMGTFVYVYFPDLH
uniref:phosphatidate cytidylyltransferase n=1 Tax=Macrostomum lignano TaxID=282301 RepID=A0A1I8FSB7_9PLAT